VFILKPFYEQMQKAPVYALETTLEQRIARLVQDYANLPNHELAAAIIRLQTRLGPQHAKTALACLAAGNYAEVARITLVYYDKAYKASQGPRQGGVALVDGDIVAAAKKLITI
jgi:tRNA 2-selenouridine synthase